jgi:hypothetical protein
MGVRRNKRSDVLLADSATEGLKVVELRKWLLARK